MVTFYLWTAAVIFVLGLIFMLISVYDFKESVKIFNEKTADQEKSAYNQRHRNITFKEIETWKCRERKYIKYGLFSMLLAALWPIVLFGAIPAYVTWWLGGRIGEGVRIVIKGE